MTSPSLSVADVIELTTERIAYGGDAVGRYDGLAVFVPMAASGERLRVRIVERKPRYARAVIEAILSPSPFRREARCRHFGDCGGCQLQHLSYPTQLEAKNRFISDALARIGHIDWPDKIEIRAAAEFGYRDRAQIRVETPKSAELRVGFHRARSHSVCDVTTCPLLVPELGSVFDSVRDAIKSSLAETATGPRSSHVREIDVAADANGISYEPDLPGLPSRPIKREICGATYLSTAAAFFQVNRFLIDELAEEAVGGASGGLAIDLYAGAGLFTIPLARRFARVIGVESDGRAASLACNNLSVNNVENVDFFHQRVEDWLQNFISSRANSESLAPDLVLLDPPRQGAAAAIDGIAALKPRFITYVACDPNTLARDLRRLIDAGYALSRIIAFDLFPQTYHVETIASLRITCD